jgi:ectoine hydroxylase-related dioxygenase (phytanoyl-CoA dioxygenase family)
MKLKNEFVREINENGVSVVSGLLDRDLVARLKLALSLAIEKEADYHRSREYKDFGMVLLCSLYDRCFTELCGHEELMGYFESILGDGCIIYAYTSSSMPPNGTNYSNRIHVDCPRIIPGYITNLGATIALDDFTAENGATWYLPRSHSINDQPDERSFFQKASRFIAPAGSVLFFNARIWHCGGTNNTELWRHGLTMNMGRPWMKQRIDIPRAMSSMDVSYASAKALQKLGFYAQPPSSYHEYFAPPESRTFRQNYE